MIKREKIKITEIEAKQTNIFAENVAVELPKEIKKMMDLITIYHQKFYRGFL
jgi:hypothetical protein